MRKSYTFLKFYSNLHIIITVTKSLLEGFALTCLLFLFTLILSLPLGLLISFCSMSKFKPLKATSKTFVWIIRGIPLMLQLFIVYYLPGLLSNTGMNVFGKVDNLLYFKYGIDNGGAFIAAVIAFVFQSNYSRKRQRTIDKSRIRQ